MNQFLASFGGESRGGHTHLAPLDGTLVPAAVVAASAGRTPGAPGGPGGARG